MHINIIPVDPHSFLHTSPLRAKLATIRVVIVVSIVSGGGEVCIAYTSVLVNLWDPKHVLGYLYEYCSVD